MQKLVVTVQLVVLFPNGLNAIENCDEGFLQRLGMPGRMKKNKKSALKASKA